MESFTIYNKKIHIKIQETKILVITIQGVKSVFYDCLNSVNMSEHTLAMDNTMLPIEFRKVKISTKVR